MIAPNATPIEPRGPRAAAPSTTRPVYWSVRREIWENRSIYRAPLIVAAVALFGFLISAFSLPRRLRAAATLAPEEQTAAIHQPYSVVALLLVLTAFLVGVFYCLDALHGERRDRSVLFWKSLPVSDRATVLAKACVPLVVLPLLVLAVIVATQAFMVLLSTAVLLSSGPGAATLWTRLPLLQTLLVLPYGLATLALWHAPLYAGLLLISAWARRTPFLWATLPPFTLCVVEKMAFDTSHLASLLKYRLIGGVTAALDLGGGGAGTGAAQLAPGRFLATPGLWLGLGLAALFLAAAARLRRSRGPT